MRVKLSCFSTLGDESTPLASPLFLCSPAASLPPPLTALTLILISRLRLRLILSFIPRLILSRSEWQMMGNDHPLSLARRASSLTSSLRCRPGIQLRNRWLMMAVADACQVLKSTMRERLQLSSVFGAVDRVLSMLRLGLHQSFRGGSRRKFRTKRKGSRTNESPSRVILDRKRQPTMRAANQPTYQPNEPASDKQIDEEYTHGKTDQGIVPPSGTPRGYPNQQRNQRSKRSSAGNKLPRGNLLLGHSTVVDR